MKKYIALGSLLSVVSILLCPIGHAKEKPWSPNSETIAELTRPEPYGGLEKSLEKLEQLHKDGKHKEALAQGLMLTARYWERRLPFVQRCAWSLAAVEKWKDCVEAYGLVETTAKSGANVQGATQPYLEDAVSNLAVLCSLHLQGKSPENVFAPEKARTYANLTLDNYPEGKVLLWGRYEGQNFQEASLALARVSEPSRCLEIAAELSVAKDGGRRKEIGARNAIPYSFMALELWWEASRKMNVDATMAVEFLENVLATSPDPSTRGLSHLLLARVHENLAKDPKKAFTHYTRAANFNFPMVQKQWEPYRDEAKKAVARLGR